MMTGSPTSNQPPTEIILSSASVAEGESSAAIVGSFSTIDPDVGDTFTYTLISGAGSTDNALFEIIGAELRTKVTFDFESQYD